MDNMSHNRVKHSIPLLCFAEEIDLLHKICGLQNKETKCIHVFISENAILNKKNICDRTLSPYYIPPTTKRFKGLHRDNVREKSSSEREGVQIMGWLYSCVISFCQFPYLTFITTFETLCCLKKIVFQYCICVIL